MTSNTKQDRVKELYLAELPRITGLYIKNDKEYQGLFGQINGGTIKNLTVNGEVTAKRYIGGVVADAYGNSSIENCVNNASVRSTAGAAQSDNDDCRMCDSYNG